MCKWFVLSYSLMIAQQIIWGTITSQSFNGSLLLKTQVDQNIYQVIAGSRVAGREQIKPVTVEIKLILTHQK